MTFCQLLNDGADVRVVEKLLVASTASPCAAVVDRGTPAVANNGQDMVDAFSRLVDVCIVHDLPLKRWVHGRVEKQLRQRVVIRVKKSTGEKDSWARQEVGSDQAYDDHPIVQSRLVRDGNGSQSR